MCLVSPEPDLGHHTDHPACLRGWVGLFESLHDLKKVVVKQLEFRFGRRFFDATEKHAIN